jgi:hypothetical protein
LPQADGEDRYNNKGAVAVLSGPTYAEPRYVQYEAVHPRPVVPAYYDYNNIAGSDEEMDIDGGDDSDPEWAPSSVGKREDYLPANLPLSAADTLDAEGAAPSPPDPTGVPGAEDGDTVLAAREVGMGEGVSPTCTHVAQHDAAVASSDMEAAGVE